MKVSKLFNGLMLFVMLGLTGGLYAQNAHEFIVVKISDDVVVGKTVLPAGEYQIQNSSLVSPLLQFFSNDRLRYESTAWAMRTDIDRNKSIKDTKVVLEKIGSQYYLTEIWVRGRPTGLQFPLPERARKIKREYELAKNAPVEQVVVLASVVQ